jgi:hypothetical protein
MAQCGCCGQYITTWNELREREVEDNLVVELLQSLDGSWKKVADNAVQLNLPDGYVTVIVRPFIKEL